MGGGEGRCEQAAPATPPEAVSSKTMRDVHGKIWKELEELDASACPVPCRQRKCRLSRVADHSKRPLYGDGRGLRCEVSLLLAASRGAILYTWALLVIVIVIVAVVIV